MNEFVVYVLYSETHNKTYTGYTSDLINRFHSHNHFAGKGYTIRYRPWTVVYVEFYSTQREARNRELYLKTGVGREFLRSQTNFR